MRFEDSTPSLEMSNIRITFEANLIQLYAHVIEFQAKIVRYMNSGLTLRAAKSMIRFDEWDKTVEKLRDCESMCKENLDAMKPGELERRSKQLGDQMSTLLDAQDELWRDFCHGFKSVKQDIQDLRQDQNIRLLTAEEGDCMRSLNTSPYWKYKDRNPKRMAGTCEWVLGHESFVRWRDNMDSGVLWISGIPGCGKSVLTRYLIDNDLLSATTRTTCYFFFKDDVNETKKH